MADPENRTRSFDVGLALSLSSAAMELGVETWIEPVIEGHFDSVWSLENPLSDQGEPLVWLAAASALAPHAAVGTAALIAPLRHPLLLARQLATLDHICRGRLYVGLTIGRRTADYEISGAAFSRRGRALDATIDALRAVWSAGPIDFDSEVWTAQSKAPLGLRPNSDAGPTLLVGGHADAALERAAERGNGYLAGATSGPAHARETRRRIVEMLDRNARDERDYRFVANLFVRVAESRDEALAHAVDTFTARHGGPPPYDPRLVVAGGPEEQVASVVVELFDSGYEGVNLVPVDMSIDQVHAAAGVARLARQ